MTRVKTKEVEISDELLNKLNSLPDNRINVVTKEQRRAIEVFGALKSYRSLSEALGLSSGVVREIYINYLKENNTTREAERVRIRSEK